ncbi:NADH dehydrogenase [ubiquinone] 1 alpha subcomplex subunit 13-like [Gigantopelta aegis]|uniref:NADH dehydrogenase [ubiquinone] 1 alpha subcomplex subunit 13-like n=1 Tax=Gigantopelta aegis TaxID=1735272 RepID=UPI001B88750F|nr:NADH dehydrogenase [ubiquinone] 1 alpha subcomplex subunit 13-like [Gigantopelta aegis]
MSMIKLSSPKGGYPEIKWSRNLPRRGPSGLMTILGGVQSNKERRRLRKEQLNARLSLLPLVQAEEDRRILRAMKAFEAEEALIMKDVPGWKVGESVYHTDKWVPPNPAQ